MPNLILEAQPATDPPVEGLMVERVRDERTLRDHVRVVAEAFGWPAEDLTLVFNRALLVDADWSGWVGYAGDEPAATSQLVEHDGVGGIYYVGTGERFRRRGYGAALTGAAVRDGFARGCSLVSLQASPAGYPLYRRMGFTDAGEYLTYLPGEN
jgi:ribosomal protein S18 acetylase RimI-like enzyme